MSMSSSHFYDNDWLVCNLKWEPEQYMDAHEIFFYDDDTWCLISSGKLNNIGIPYAV